MVALRIRLLITIACVGLAPPALAQTVEVSAEGRPSG